MTDASMMAVGNNDSQHEPQDAVCSLVERGVRDMRKILMLLLVVGGLGAFGGGRAHAVPMSASPIELAREAASLIQEARVYCYNRRTGRFLHWGHCRRHVVRRVYCYNRRTGRFLHWGRC
jgi:hypothetical protein